METECKADRRKKFTDEQIKSIKQARDSGEPWRKIAQRFNISTSHACNVYYGRERK